MNWRGLEVHESGEFLGELGGLVEYAPADLDTCELAGDGSISEWPQHFICRPGEEPAWDTPREPVDWSGFEQALMTARGRGEEN